MRQSRATRMSTGAARRCRCFTCGRNTSVSSAMTRVTWIAAKLGLQPINILELVTFYPMFRQEPAGKTHIRVCRTLSCAMAGGFQLMENLCAATGIDRANDQGEGMHNPISVSADGNYSVEFVECLASCGTAPVCMVNEELHENVSPIPSRSFSEIKPDKSDIEHSSHALERRLIFKNLGRDDWTTDIDCYLRAGGYEQLKQALTMSRARDCQQSQELRVAWPRRRRFFVRAEVELHQT